MILGIIGLGCGALNALLGIGGGVAVVPALVLCAGFSQKAAQAASLWYVVPTSLFAGLLYTREEDISLRFVAAMVVAALIGVTIGVRLVKRIDQRHLRAIFGAAVILIAVAMIVRTCQGEYTGFHRETNVQYLVLTWTGLAAGFLSSLLGIGGGVIVVPALAMIAGFNQRLAQGMSLFYIVPTALYAAVMYRYHAKITIDAVQTALMIVMGAFGAFIGYQLMRGIPLRELRLLFAAALFGVGILIIVRAMKERRAAPPPDWVI